MTTRTAPTGLGARFGITLGGANFGLQMVVHSVPHVLLAMQIADLDPRGKELRLGIATAVAALVVSVAQPLWGALSDRTRTRYGRRSPYILGGALLSGVGLLSLAVTDDFLGLIIAWCGTSAAFTATNATLMSALPDRVPESARGIFAAIAGLGGILGALCGQILISKLAGGGYLLPYAVVALVFAGTAAVFVLFSPEPAPNTTVTQRFSLRSLWVDPRRHPDFAWVFASRLCTLTGFFMVNSYLLYILADHLHLGSDEALRQLPAVSAVSVVTVVVSLVLAGIWSDRVGRRIPFVFWSAIVIAGGLLSAGFARSIPAMLGCVVVLSVGYGVFRALDEALVSLVLPSRESAAQHLGTAHLATNISNAAAPALAGVVINFGGGYTAFFPLAAVLALLGGLCVLPVRSVR
ncbi:MFS transporter [Nocardia inohanensis]|uniref:MFS transporter n=1 Tax=Nocardia inohanensis TaxID=209246 RepID=UPI000833DA8F|nr:MFS transporter [Nocardia inohanensis]